MIPFYPASPCVCLLLQRWCNNHLLYSSYMDYNSQESIWLSTTADWWDECNLVCWCNYKIICLVYVFTIYTDHWCIHQLYHCAVIFIIFFYLLKKLFSCDFAIINLLILVDTENFFILLSEFSHWCKVEYLKRY